MANETCSELNQLIHRWREDLGQSPALRQQDVEELELHLRDSCDALMGKGLSTEEAFLIATRRIGQAERLEEEFSKTNASRALSLRAIWMIVGAIGFSVAHSIATLTSNLTMLPALSLYREGPALGPCATMIRLFTFVGLIVMGWRLMGRRKRMGRKVLEYSSRRPVLACLAGIMAFALIYVLPELSFVGVSRCLGLVPSRIQGIQPWWMLSSMIIQVAGLPFLLVYLARRYFDRTQTQRNTNL
jgi:hypothetical protein